MHLFYVCSLNKYETHVTQERLIGIIFDIINYVNDKYEFISSREQLLITSISQCFELSKKRTIAVVYLEIKRK